MSNAYLARLTDLGHKKEETLAKQIGLPLKRPGFTSTNNMAIEPPKEDNPQEQELDMTSQFGMNFENFKNQDKRFDSMMQDYTKLATGLRQAVDQGFMPRVIAEQKLKQYIGDSANYFNTHKATPMDNPQVANLIEGVLKKASGVSEEGQPMPEQQMPQGGM